ncbi:MAG: hypothetical protein JW891_04005 [Candidatus Lokiarchaeota archaeon]|nr:hypothetical protein [Candidatus Lokiarchaeota archaeon]
MPFSKHLSSVLKTSQSSVTNTSKSPKDQIFEWIDKNVYGPGEKVRNEGRSHIWVCAMNKEGDKAEAWLETIEPYRFTFISGVMCVERILKSKPVGSLTPSMAFGEDFVLSFPDTYRYDNLD